jgi:rubrerythrin
LPIEEAMVAPTGKSLHVTPIHELQPLAGGTDAMELIWRCGDCGHIVQQVASPPERCPDCGAPREHFFRVTED